MELEKRIKRILNELNIRINLKGYKYWVEAVKYIIENNKTSYSITKEIYTYLADKHVDTGHRVERALRHTLDGKQEEIQQYFGISYKIDNSTLLALIVDKVRTEMSED